MKMQIWAVWVFCALLVCVGNGVVAQQSQAPDAKALEARFNAQYAEYEEVFANYKPTSKKVAAKLSDLRKTAKALAAERQEELETLQKQWDANVEDELREDIPEMVELHAKIESLKGNLENAPSDNSSAEELCVFVSAAGKKMTKIVDGIEYRFRWCPAGSFQMGSENGYDKEKPVHTVTFSQGFWMLETEVTVGMFRSFVKQTGYKSQGDTPCGWTGSTFKRDLKYSWEDPGFSQTEKCPVTCVSWKDANAFSEWLSKQVGMSCSLPTEAEWEYACRAGTTGYYAGNLDEMAWYGGGKGTHEVGLKKPNEWGLYDMHGNVWEWCSDWYDSGYYTKSPASDPTGPEEEGSDRVFRGGCWGSDAEYCRSANRLDSSPGNRCNFLGLRLVCGIQSSQGK